MKKLPSGKTKLPRIVLPLLLLGGFITVSSYANREARIDEVSYSAFLNHLEKDKLQKVEIRGRALIADLKESAEGPSRIQTVRLPGIDESKLVERLSSRGVEFVGRTEEPSVWPVLIGWLVPLSILFGLYFVLFRRISKNITGSGGPFGVGKSRAKRFDATEDTKVTFTDVAGIDESVAEMKEVVDFLKHPDRYKALGAKIPKGVLLVGPPGTGKTLLAKAVAGEAEVPFFSLSGSDFVEMFVGVGAARVRDLFEQAATQSPCIIFIDEIDGIGKSRGGGAAFGGHDEREQTLNQLLSEMDGFDARTGIVIIAATNRPEVLDSALVRAGRFDRQVVVDRPSVHGRLAILQVHARQVRISETVDLHVVARRTPGMVGADLAKVVNEAALAAARQHRTEVTQHDFEEAVDRIQLGLEKQGRAMSEEEKRRVAFHEAGHALVAMSVEKADPVHRVTIIPRSIGALGATLQLPTEDRYLMLKSELKDRIAVMLGGRAAEQLVYGEVSSGASNDLERATETARQMVMKFGMSDAMGAISYGRSRGARYLDAMGEERNYSEETSQRLDREIQQIISTEDVRALEILTERRAVLNAIVDRLLDEETLDADALNAIVAA
ncbi:MAG: ATP-dependent zinc metalloprotease FtsH [Myxococcota bacterium]